jgi:hypothetical protein
VVVPEVPPVVVPPLVEPPLVVVLVAAVVVPVVVVPLWLDEQASVAAINAIPQQ